MDHGRTGRSSAYPWVYVVGAVPVLSVVDVPGGQLTEYRGGSSTMTVLRLDKLLSALPVRADTGPSRYVPRCGRCFRASRSGDSQVSTGRVGTPLRLSSHMSGN